MVATPLALALPCVAGAVEGLLRDPNTNNTNVKAALKVQWKQQHKNWGGRGEAQGRRRGACGRLRGVGVAWCRVG